MLIVSTFALPSILRSLARVNRHLYLIFCLVSVVGFVIGFSTIFNLGILARQRIQVLPFLLAILIVMGKGRIPDDRDDATGDAVDPRGLSLQTASPGGTTI